MRDAASAALLVENDENDENPKQGKAEGLSLKEPT